jgi:hypothetical protein
MSSHVYLNTSVWTKKKFLVLEKIGGAASETVNPILVEN